MSPILSVLKEGGSREERSEICTGVLVHWIGLRHRKGPGNWKRDFMLSVWCAKLFDDAEPTGNLVCCLLEPVSC